LLFIAAEQFAGGYVPHTPFSALRPQQQAGHRWGFPGCRWWL